MNRQILIYMYDFLTQQRLVLAIKNCPIRDDGNESKLEGINGTILPIISVVRMSGCLSSAKPPSSNTV